ncbi:MAG: DUF5317 domain-containing protein [Caldicoprobacterales bacterium]|jgi:hypothetical protein|nr:DUF5317 domain-containing protein [Clostridiales bacterium]
MLFVTLAGALILGLARGGKITNLTKAKLMHSWLIFLSVLFEALLLLLSRNNIAPALPIVFTCITLQYLLLFLFVWLNRHLPYSWLIALGSFLNGLVILINGGTMPLADIRSCIGNAEFTYEYLINGSLPIYHIINENTLLWFLGDVIIIPYPFSAFISVGDILLYAGVFLLIQHLVAGKSHKKKQPV